MNRRDLAYQALGVVVGLGFALITAGVAGLYLEVPWSALLLGTLGVVWAATSLTTTALRPDTKRGALSVPVVALRGPAVATADRAPI